MLFIMPVFGINQGAQPILGFNYGAKQFDRVRKAFLLAISGATILCLLGFILGQLFPHFLVRIFTPNGSPALLSFAPTALRVILIGMPLNGFTIVSTNFFVITGRPKISIFLSMLRQVIALIPCLLIFGKIWGLWGVVSAMPLADGFAFICTGTLILLELRKLKDDHQTRLQG
jgi:Na+-driven multidrug efflux pump